MMNEEWKPIKNHENEYEISNLGRVRSLDRYIKSANSKTGLQFKKGQILKQKLNKVNGYMMIILWKDNKQKGYNIHRLVAEHFLPIKEGKNTVNHIDGDKTNNRVDNLEWVSYGENLAHAYKKLERPINKRSLYKQSIYYMNREGVVKLVDSIEQGSRETGVSPTQIRRLLDTNKFCRRGFLFSTVKPSVEDIERVDSN